MGAEQLGIQPNAGDPSGDKPCILARRHAPAEPAAAREQKFTRLLARSSQVVIDGLTGRPVKFELTDQTRQAVDDYLRATAIFDRC
jgi:hypothetical protein